MKKIIGITLSVFLILALAGCGSAQEIKPEAESLTENTEAKSSDDNNEIVKDTDESETTPSIETEDSNILVVYFSRTGEQYSVGVIDKGNTAIVADMIVTATGADSFEILPADDHYPVTYDELTEVAKEEQNENARPEISGTLPDLSQYETIFIGSPVWWGDWPMICYTYFEANDFSGKTIIPFSTHAGSGLAGFDEKLSDYTSDAKIGKGLSIKGEDAQNNQEEVKLEMEKWLSELGF